MSNSSPHNRWLVRVLALALAAVTIFIYLPTRQFDFLNWDDFSYVAANDYVRGGITGKGLVWAFTEAHSANWHPLTWISHMLDCEIYGPQPAGQHITNILFHGANATLLFLLLRLLTGSLWRSALVAALFALHPLRVESVAWISERKDVLCTFFGLLCLFAYARFAQTPAPPAIQSRSRQLWYGLALVFYALGLLSKPMLVTWPCVMLLLDYWPLRRIELSATTARFSMVKQLVWEKLPFLALAVVSCIVTVLAQKRGGAVASFEHVPFGARLENAAVAYVAYLFNFFWPTNLSPIYPLMKQLEWPRVTGAVGLLVLLTAAAWRIRVRFPYVITGWFWFLGTLVPVIGLIQVGGAAYADRYTYIPGIGLVLALVWLAAEVCNLVRLPRFTLTIFAITWLLVLAWLTSGQLRIWKNTETLFRRTLELYPDCVPALFGLGQRLVETGETGEAKSMLERAIQLQPEYSSGWGAMALLRDDEGNFTEAIRYYRAALGVEPGNAIALNNLAWLLAACTNPALRDGPEAVRLATKACEVTGYSKPLFIGTLAAAQAETGDFQSAITTAERAAVRAADLRLDETVRKNREMIELYRQGRAAHGGLPQGK